jgi:peptidoglycan/xylan/chitin deacetylase (PgdA/CDA1 family)
MSGHLVVRRRDVARWDAPRPFVPVAGLRGVLLAVARPVSVVACVHTHASELALTFDDGPDPTSTPAVLDVLDRHQRRATFFVLGDRAIAHPELIRRMVHSGHEVALHGLDHARLTQASTRAAVTQLRRARQQVSDIVGGPVSLFRPAYGALTAAQTVAARAVGLQVVLWSGWCRDWEDATASDVAAQAVAASHPGGFLLLHDASPDGDTPAYSRVDMLEQALTALDRRGLVSSTVTDLLAQHPHVRTIWAAPGRRRTQVAA